MSDARRGPVALVILDGWGLRQETHGNAVAGARHPVFDRLWESYPHGQLIASGEDVGLPPGQMGNSEVGHLNLGAGRVVYQDITRISRAIADGSFFEIENLQDAMDSARKHRLHLLGLLSDGGVHATLGHVEALVDMAARHGVTELYLHLFSDGRDTLPHAGEDFLKRVLACLERHGVGRVATLCGRYWAMDRDKRWDRTERAWRMLVRGEARTATDPLKTLQDSYAAGVTDEFLEPTVLVDAQGQPLGLIEDDDVVVCFNFRADRMRQIVRAFSERDFGTDDENVPGERHEGFDRGDTVPLPHMLTMTEYEADFDVEVVFDPQEMDGLLGEVVSRAGRTQLRIAETEKYAHVTYFFNGGGETPFAGEDRHLVPSPKVATYDLAPEMRAPDIARDAARLLQEKGYDFMVLNFANPDMVGHTGVYEAAVQAVEATDTALGVVADTVLAMGGALLVTADHGNCELMIDPGTGGPHTAHTTNPVPIILVDDARTGAALREGGRLADIAPTLLELLGLTPSRKMTGRSLIKKLSAISYQPSAGKADS